MYCLLPKTSRFLLCCITCFAQTFWLFQPSPSQVKVEFRLAEIDPGPGLTPAKVDGPQQMIYLHKDVIITNEDISEAQAREEPNAFGLYEVIVVFTKKGAERMAIATKPERGLLAILVDGKVVVALGIPTQIYDKAVISVPTTKKDAENLAAMLNKKSRARR